MWEYIKKLLRESLRTFETGFIAFNLQRITGILVLLYLFAHIAVLRAIAGGEQVYTQRIEVMTNPVFRFFEWLLLFTVIFHSINGIRILCVDFLGMVKLQKPLFGAVAFIVAVVMVVSIPYFIGIAH